MSRDTFATTGLKLPQETINVYCGNTSSGPSTLEKVGTAAAVGVIGGLLSGLRKCSAVEGSGGYGGGGSAAAEPTQEQILKADINKYNLQLAENQAMLSSYDKDLNSLSVKIDPTTIANKKSAAETLKKELEDNNNKELVKQIETDNAAIEVATMDVNTCQSNFDKSLEDLNNAKRLLDAAKINKENPEEGEDAVELQAKVDSAQADVDSKNKLHEENKTKLEQARENLRKKNEDKKKHLEEKNSNYKQIEDKLNTYNKLMADIQILESALETNKAEFNKITAAKAKLEADTIPMLEGKIKNAMDELTLLQADQRSGKKKASKQYAEADANDGNWWKRNMPSWLGGSKKANKAIYRQNHALKQEAESTLSSFGTSQKEIINQRLTRFINKNSDLKGDSKQILKYIKDHPYASDDEIKDNYKRYK